MNYLKFVFFLQILRAKFNVFAPVVIAFLLLAGGAFAQAPQGINYQAVARDADGNPILNQNIGVRITLNDGNGGPLFYQETHNTTTNQFGLFTLVLGTGSPSGQIFSMISWASVTPWLQVEIDPAGGTNYLNMGSSQLLSVPYAFYALSGNPGPAGPQGIQGIQGVPGPAGSANISGTTNYVVKFSGSSTGANSQIFDNGTNIGINTNTPVGKLNLKGSANISQLVVDANNVQNNSNPIIKLRNSAGSDLLWINSDGPSNTFIGNNSGKVNTAAVGGYHNTFVGAEAGKSNTMGYDNTASGYGALVNNTEGSENTATGANSLYANTLGYQNTANGFNSLYSNTEGYCNTANGKDALYSNTTGSQNTAIGLKALFYNTTGWSNMASGYKSLKSNSGGHYNTANGVEALYSNYNGYSNTAIGNSALYNNTNGNNNTALGSSSFHNGAIFSNSTALGYSAAITASNQVRIGNSSVTSIGGYLNWSNISDGRFKMNLRENVPGLSFILKLKPVTYNLDIEKLNHFLQIPDSISKADDFSMKSMHEKSEQVQTGFVAQDVEAVARELGFDFSGIDKPKNENDHYGLRYAEFVVPLVKAVQEQQEIINSLLKRIENLENK